ncbi:GGDEF domain-containing protein [Rubinisphaera margarita]|uniref:GGDEF domain-containing protein n=1 Tax=Rubinisphaera margarita TaxID=2909586 RepID=UPI001EE890D7|nr:diguanylate cyclase [Rubinisphaera margarita]MCG6154874.1 diguanylate cyclase [Rubinisphaera margarita]
MDFTIALQLPALSREMMLVIILVPLALAVGFAFGLLYERWYQSAALQRASKRFEKLFKHVSGCLDHAERACSLLQRKAAQQKLTPGQTAHLGDARESLMRQMTQLIDSSAAPSATSSPPARRKTFRAPRWSKYPVDSRTDLPDFTAWQQNLKKLNRSLAGTSATCGVIFIQLDHFSRLAQHNGQPAVNGFLRQTASIALRRFRSEDLLCQATDDLLIGLLPDISRDAVRHIADRIRGELRNTLFVHPDTEQQIFVTATFGCTTFTNTDCSLEELQDLLWQRGQSSLRTSPRHGRCQLREVHPDGSIQLIAS